MSKPAAPAAEELANAKLKKVAEPVNAGEVRAKTLLAATGKKAKEALKHVDAPDTGLSEEVKAAYLKEKEEASAE